MNDKYENKGKISHFLDGFSLDLVIEIINFNRELLKKLQEAGVRLEDVQYVELYSEYMYRTSQGEKVSYAVAVLSEKYSVSERTIYALVKRFRSDCKTFAV